MELNRNHFFLLGAIALFLGIQFRLVESFVLNEQTSRFVAKKLDWKGDNKTSVPLLNTMSPLIPAYRAARTVSPPRWLGWSLVSLGAVLMLYSLAMRKPD